MACCVASYYCRTELPLRSLFLPRRDGQLVDGLSRVVVGLGQALLHERFGCLSLLTTTADFVLVASVLLAARFYRFQLELWEHLLPT